MTRPKGKAIERRSGLDSRKLTHGLPRLQQTLYSPCWSRREFLLPQLCPVFSLLLPVAVGSPLGLHFSRLDKPSSHDVSMTYSGPHHLGTICCTRSSISVSVLVLRSPELDTALLVQSPKRETEAEEHFPRPAGYTHA